MLSFPDKQGRRAAQICEKCLIPIVAVAGFLKARGGLDFVYASKQAHIIPGDAFGAGAALRRCSCSGREGGVSFKPRELLSANGGEPRRHNLGNWS